MPSLKPYQLEQQRQAIERRMLADRRKKIRDGVHSVFHPIEPAR